MEESIASELPLRILALGNDLLADDVLGLLAGREAARRFGAKVEVACSSAAGLHLLEDVLGAGRLVVIDTIVTGRGEPGTVRVFREGELAAPPGGSPHSSGIFDAVALARQLGLAVPAEITVIAVEGADCTTIGGPVHPAVERAVEPVLNEIGKLVAI